MFVYQLHDVLTKFIPSSHFYYILTYNNGFFVFLLLISFFEI